MDTYKRTEGTRSLKIVNEIGSLLPMKPLGVSNSRTTYERKNFYGSVQKSPTSARKTLFEDAAKENNDFALCKEFYSNRENTGKSPVVVLKNSNSKDSQDKVKVKPRRSMLGLRSKTQLNFMKDVSKPLHASSPNDERVDSSENSDLIPLHRKSVSTPVLTPFDTDDHDASAFFNKGISDSTWSVFKSVKKKSEFEPRVTRASLAAGKTRSQTRSLISSVDQEAKLKWLANQYQTEGNSLPHKNRKEIAKKNQNNYHSEDDYSSGIGVDSVEQEECYDPNKSVSPLRDPVPENVSPIEKVTYQPQVFDESYDGSDSYSENEKTILNSCENNLEQIQEESDDRDVIGDENTSMSSSENDQVVETPIDYIMNLFEDLQKEKEIMENKWHALFKQKESWDKKWDNLTSELRKYASNAKSVKKDLVNCNPSETKPNKSTKSRFSLASPNPRALPRASAKSYSDLKKKFSVCKTPITSDKRLNRFRKSMCYTPNSLSIRVKDQEKDIFD